MAILPADEQGVRCPGCGSRATLGPDEAAIEPCARCTTRLISYGRRLDVEGSVRDRLYGEAPRGIDAATPRRR